MRKPQVVKNLAFKVIGEETIILDTKVNKAVHHLNEVGSHIWKFCDGAHEVRTIVAEVCKEFDVDETIAQKEVNDFLTELFQKNLIIDSDT